MHTTTKIGEKIAVARKLKNLSQSELATALAVTSQAVGKWERGESMPDFLTFAALADVLGVDLNYFGGNSSTSQNATPSPDKVDKYKKGLARRLKWNMSGGDWRDADFSGLQGLGEKFSGANIQDCKFIGSDLSDLHLRGNNIVRSDFARGSLRGSRFAGCNIHACNFDNCDLTDVEYKGSNIQKSDFTGADFSDATFEGSHIGGKTSVTGARWFQTTFRRTYLSDITLDGEITDCVFEGMVPARVVFRNVTLRNTFFKNCKLKKLRFENCSADKLTLAFLKNSKADVSKIKLLEEENS
jgi:uncharacterized protein YjbI with pentapeptide repeats